MNGNVAIVCLGVAVGLAPFAVSAVAQWSRAEPLREWSPAVMLATWAASPAVVVIALGTDAFLPFAFGVLLSFAFDMPIILVVFAIVAIVRRRRGRSPLPQPRPPSRILGSPVAQLPSGALVRTRPVWTRRRRLAERVETDGEVIEVEHGAAATIRELLELDPDTFARGGTHWYEVLETREPEWPALVVHVGAVQTKVVARVSSTALAHRLAVLRDGTKNARTPLVRSARYWFRVPI